MHSSDMILLFRPFFNQLEVGIRVALLKYYISTFGGMGGLTRNAYLLMGLGGGGRS